MAMLILNLKHAFFSIPNLLELIIKTIFESSSFDVKSAQLKREFLKGGWLALHIEASQVLEVSQL